MAGEIIIPIVGNLTADPELRFTPSGTAVASFSVASTPRTFDKASGGWKDGDASFFRCVAWKQLAENIAETFSRGDRVVMLGEIAQETWETREGEKRSGFKVTARSIGPEITFRPAKISRADREKGQSPAADPWGTPQDDPWGQPPPKAASGGSADQPPF